MESTFERVGSCGCFQICHVLLLQLTCMVHAWCLYLMVFGNYEPPWECLQQNTTVKNPTLPYNDTAKNTTNHTLQYGSAVRGMYDSSNNVFSFKSPSSNSNGNTSNDNTTYNFNQGTCDQLPLCDEIRFDPTSVTLVTEFGLICDHAYIPSLIIAVQMSGMVVGAYLGGQLGESYGRKVSLYSSLALMSVSCLVAAWSVSWQMYACLMFVVGFGEGGVSSTNYVHALEFLTSKWRGRFAAMPTWNLAVLLFALFALAFKNLWQIHIIVATVSSLIILSVLWVPESLRWLYVNGKESEAKKVLQKVMKCNRCSESVNEVFQGLKDTNVYCINEGPVKKYTYLELFRNPLLKITTVKCLTVGFLLSLSYYTLGYSVKALSGDYYTNLLLSCGLELPFLLFVIPCVNRFGRKFTITYLLALGTLCTLACVIVFYVTDYETSGPIIAYLAIVAKGSSCMAWTTNVIYAGELFPTAVRSLAMGLSNTVSRAGVILGAAIIPSDQESLVIFFIVLSFGMLVSCVIIVTLPETKGKPLEDVLEQTRQPLEDVTDSFDKTTRPIALPGDDPGDVDQTVA